MQTKSLTYAELGTALGITAASAKRLAIRRGWPKSAGNDGKARVMAPLEYLERPSPATDDTTRDTAGDTTRDAPGNAANDVTGDARALITMLESRVTELSAEVADLRPKAERAAVAEALLQAERTRLDEVRADREAWREQAIRLTTVPAPTSRAWWPWTRRRA